jgi:segregation and condensation protein A
VGKNSKLDDFAKPPLNLLTNPDEMRGQKPWDVNVSQLLDLFIRMVEQMDTPDLRLCGSAALSSALIYRLKVESLFLFEKLKVKRQVIDRGQPPYLLDLPYRYELSTTSLEDLVVTLEGILEEMLTYEPAEKRQKPSIMEADPIFEVDTFSTQIQKVLVDLKRDIANVLRLQKTILFSEYVKKMDLLEKIRTLLLLLFTANDGLIRMIQQEEDILITGAVQDDTQ